MTRPEDRLHRGAGSHGSRDPGRGRRKTCLGTRSFWAPRRRFSWPVAGWRRSSRPAGWTRWWRSGLN